MSNFSKNLFLGIDIGAGAIKCVVLSREKGERLKLVKADYQQYEYLPQTNMQQQTAAISSTIKNFLRQEKISQKTKIGLSITGQLAFIRLVKIPLTDPKKLKQIILYEVQQQVPFPIKDVVWDFQIYDRDGKDLSVLLAAVKKELITSIYRAVEACGLEVDFIDVSNLSLYNCLQHFFRTLDKMLILDIGAKTTNVLIVNNAKIWTRSLPVGGNDITEAIGQALKTDRPQAEQIKQKKGEVLILYYGKKDAALDEHQKTAEAITGILTDLSGEIVKTLNFYKAQINRKIEIKRVLLTGGTSKIKNTDKFFEQSLAMPCEKIDYFNFLGFNAKIDVQVDEFLGAALGLSLRGFGYSHLNINLLPPEQVEEKILKKKSPFIILSLVFLFFILVSSNIYLYHRKVISQNYVKRLRQMTLDYKYTGKSKQQLNAQIRLIESKINSSARILKERNLIYNVLNYLAEAIPESIWIENLTYDADDNYLILQGYTEKDLTAIDNFQNELKKKDKFEKIQIQTIAKDTEKGISFSLKILLKLD